MEALNQLCKHLSTSAPAFDDRSKRSECWAAPSGSDAKPRVMWAGRAVPSEHSIRRTASSVVALSRPSVSSTALSLWRQRPAEIPGQDLTGGQPGSVAAAASAGATTAAFALLSFAQQHAASLTSHLTLPFQPASPSALDQQNPTWSSPTIASSEPGISFHPIPLASITNSSHAAVPVVATATLTAGVAAPPAAGGSAAASAAAAAKAEVGRATWTLLHTLAAQFPERPTRQQQRDARTLVDCLTRIYPCGDCAAHFAELVRRDPPVVSSGRAFRRWLCQVHNRVNARIGKPSFNCDLVESRWAPLGCSKEEAEAGEPPSAGCELRGVGASGRGGR